jgi:hypothetical protein
MDIGKLLITVGVVTVIAGIVITYMPNFFGWFVEILPALKGYNGDSLLLRRRCVSLLPTGFCC